MISVVVTGNLGSDAECKTVGANKVIKFSVASNKKVKGESSVTWVGVDYWRDSKVIDYLKKGTKVSVRGELTTSIGKDGRTFLNVRADDVELIGDAKGRDGGSAGSDDDDIAF